MKNKSTILDLKRLAENKDVQGVFDEGLQKNKQASPILNKEFTASGTKLMEQASLKV